MGSSNYTMGSRRGTRRAHRREPRGAAVVRMAAAAMRPGYAIAAAGGIAISLLLAIVCPHAPSGITQSPYLLLVMAMAYIYGVGPAIVAIITSALMVMNSAVRSSGIGPEDIVRLLAFLTTCSVAGWAMITVRRSGRRAQLLMRDLKQSDETIASVLESITDGFIALDRDWRFTYVNRAAERLLYRSRRDLAGLSMWEAFPSAIFSRFYMACYHAMYQHANQAVQDALPCSDSLFECRIYPSESGLAIYLRDVTEEQRSEEHRRDFYRRTILAATEGKLEIVDKEIIFRMAGPPMETWRVAKSEDLRSIRRAMGDIARANSMEDGKIYDLTLCAGEALTNCIKHAPGGIASLHVVARSLIFVVSDTGPGIEALNLPEVALTKGYSTAGTLGMGYKAMINLADKVYLATTEAGTTVAIRSDIA